ISLGKAENQSFLGFQSRAAHQLRRVWFFDITTALRRAATQCPLWVKSGKAQNEQMLQMLPACPRKRTSDLRVLMSTRPKPRNAIVASQWSAVPRRGTARWRGWSRRGTAGGGGVGPGGAERFECRRRRQAPPFPRATSAASRRHKPRGSEPPRAAPDRETRRGLRADRDGR